MMAEQHTSEPTPGPWEAVPDRPPPDIPDARPFVIVDQDGNVLADLWHGPTEANAALIADAPRLKAVNEELLKALRTSAMNCAGCDGDGYVIRGVGTKEEIPCPHCQIARTAIAKATGESA